MFPGGIMEEEPEAGRVDASGNPLKYVVLHCEQGPGPNQYSTAVGGVVPYVDFRHVTFELYGVGTEQMGQAKGVVKAAFDPPATLQTTGGFMCIQPLEDGFTREKSRKKGELVRKAMVQYCVWTNRTNP
jgi:hypothetical protein